MLQDFNFTFKASGILGGRIDRQGKRKDGTDWNFSRYPLKMLGQTFEIDAEHFPGNQNPESYVGKEIIIEGEVVYKGYDDVKFDIKTLTCPAGQSKKV